MEASNFLGPRERFGIVPGLFTPGHGERPIEKIADVGENFGGSADAFGRAEAGEFWRRSPESFASAIGDGSQGVAEEFRFGILAGTRIRGHGWHLVFENRGVMSAECSQHERGASTASLNCALSLRAGQ